LPWLCYSRIQLDQIRATKILHGEFSVNKKESLSAGSQNDLDQHASREILRSAGKGAPLRMTL